MTIFPDESRLLLLAAVGLSRGEVDNYVAARLEAHGYTREQVERAARRLLARAEDEAARKPAGVADETPQAAA